MKRPSLVVPLVLAAALGATAQAAAAPPERVESIRFDPNVTEVDPFFSEVCGFPVTSRARATSA
jgi:hypothetical protein